MRLEAVTSRKSSFEKGRASKGVSSLTEAKKICIFM